MAHEEPARPRDDAVEPFFAGLRGAHESGSEPGQRPDRGAESGERTDADEGESGPPPDPWRRAGRMQAHATSAAAGDDEAAEDDRAGAGLVLKALLLMVGLVVASAAIYFVFGV